MLIALLKLYYRFTLPGASLNTKGRAVPVIVSLTTFGPRIRKVHQVLKLMLTQTVRPDRIVVYVGKDQFNESILPTKLKVFRELYGIEVQFVEDIGPHTKYFYAIKDNPAAIVITVDDDVKYPADLIAELMSSFERHPRCVSAARGHRITFDNGVIKKYREWDYKFSGLIDTPSMRLFATGVGGVLYPPQVLPAETFNLPELKRLSLKNDDIWLKFMQAIHGTRVVFTKPYVTKHIKGSQKVALNQSNVTGGGNDVMIKNLIEHYNHVLGPSDTLTNRMMVD